MNPEQMKPEAQTKSEAAPAENLDDRLLKELEASGDPHRFDIKRMQLSEDEKSAVLWLLHLYKKSENYREASWSQEEAARYAQVREIVNGMLEKNDTVPTDSDEANFVAFLRNKLVVIDLAAQYAARKKAA